MSINWDPCKTVYKDLGKKKNFECQEILRQNGFKSKPMQKKFLVQIILKNEIPKTYRRHLEGVLATRFLFPDSVFSSYF